MTENQKRNLYLQSLYINAGRTIMQKIFDEYSKYINFALMDAMLYSTHFYSLNDPIGVFFDVYCKAVEKKYFSGETLYYIMSPFHKKHVIEGMLVNTNKMFIKNMANPASCKVTKLYTMVLTGKHIKYLDFSRELFEKSKKTQQKN